MLYDILIWGGEVIDPEQGLQGRSDIAISDGKLAAFGKTISKDKAKQVIDATDCLVTPGLIDLHAHAAGKMVKISVHPDEAGIRSGVTCINDAGSIGSGNFPGFREYVLPTSRTDLFCFLHVSTAGLTSMRELWGWHDIDPEAIRETVEANRDLIKGIKIRAIRSVVSHLGVTAIEKAKKIANDCRIPLMAHLGIEPEVKLPENTVNDFTCNMLSLLERGDIVSHIFSWRQGGVITREGEVLDPLLRAMKRGVIADVAQSRDNWSCQIARKSIELNILPDVISTDVTSISIKGPGAVFSLPTTMSRFLALGLSMYQVVKATTCVPARILGEECRRGSLKLGLPADVSILKVLEGEFIFTDGMAGNSFFGSKLLIPVLTLKAGIRFTPRPIDDLLEDITKR